MYLPDSSILTNIQVQGHTRLREILFEKKYIQVRALESRLYTDEELVRLPEIAPSHPRCKEWQLRKQSARRIVRYFSRRKTDLDILEIGCGNGWLTHQLAEIPGSKVLGVDINFTELQQAARVFSNDPNLRFIHGDIRSGLLGDRSFDYILIAATLEHFPSAKKILHLCLSHLNRGGEIHIIDTRFCKPEEVKMEERRTLAYYTSFGYPEMADYYFHHTFDDLRSFRYTVLYNPKDFRNRFSKNKNQHPWIRITNN
ncbi:MAG TPA: class I SAM-dependent methyltransferase [Puia sp.]|jgi:ubiquinone/menaquinone biosynthesis C-methylase UbiE|nr:class I SAM-dependent methyltransferase [Puia sp.]